MECKTVKEYILLYYYNELDRTRTSEIKSHMKGCKDCGTEFKYLKRTMKLVNKEEKINIPFTYRKTLLNKIFQATNLKEERKILQRKRVFVFSSSFATVLILFFYLFSAIRFHNGSLDWQNNYFTYKLEELEESISETHEMISGETIQFAEEYSLDEKIDNIYEEIKELTVLLSI